jgi:hypothetical protein
MLAVESKAVLVLVLMLLVMESMQVLMLVVMLSMLVEKLVVMLSMLVLTWAVMLSETWMRMHWILAWKMNCERKKRMDWSISLDVPFPLYFNFIIVSCDASSSSHGVLLSS